MSVEADCFRVRRPNENTPEDDLIRSDSVQPGSSEVLPYFKKIKILATCDIDNLSGTVWLKTSVRRYSKLSIILFEENDEDGRRISPYAQPIKIKSGQELSIFYKKEKKEVVIFLDQENGLGDKTPPMDVDRLVRA